jgi:hypothetical protein
MIETISDPPELLLDTTFKKINTRKVGAREDVDDDFKNIYKRRL